MKILSINFGHDASLCIFSDGKLIDFAEVERESRLKHHLGLKSQFINEYLIRNNFSFENFDAICISSTQLWGIFHDECLKIQYGYSSLHKKLIKNFAFWDERLFSRGSENIKPGGFYNEHIAKQYLRCHTYSPLRRLYASPYLWKFDSNPKIIENFFNKHIDVLGTQSKEQQSDFFIPITIYLNGIEKPGFYIDHHAAHAFYAGFYSNGKAIIATHDGGLPLTCLRNYKDKKIPEMGFNSGGIYIFRKDMGLTPILSHNFALGFIYDSVAANFKIDAGKLMGLASYGRFQRKINNLVDSYIDGLFGNDFSRELNLKYVREILQISKTDNKIRASKTKKFLFNFENQITNFAIQSASNVQHFVQRIYVELISDICENIYEFDNTYKDVYMTGGFSLNCPTNSSLMATSPSLNYKPLPGVGDTGLSLGAAVALHYLIGVDVYLNHSTDLLSPAFPPSSLNAFSGKQNLKDLQMINCNPTTISSFVAKELVKGKVFCLHIGRSEVGPRALGHRSIIAWAGSENIRDIINDKKGRERWRPLAPICSVEDFPTYFTGDIEDARFMLTISKSKTSKIPGVTHVDNTARVQVIDQSESFLYSVLTELRNLKVDPVIINTSFNCAGEPVVETFKDAAKSFIDMGFDYLISEKDIFIKNNESMPIH